MLSKVWIEIINQFPKVNGYNFKIWEFKFQIQIQNSLLLPIYIVLIIYDDMDTMYMYFSGTIS